MSLVKQWPLLLACTDAIQLKFYFFAPFLYKGNLDLVRSIFMFHQNFKFFSPKQKTNNVVSYKFVEEVLSVYFLAHLISFFIITFCTKWTQNFTIFTWMHYKKKHDWRLILFCLRFKYKLFINLKFAVMMRHWNYDPCMVLNWKLSSNFFFE